MDGRKNAMMMIYLDARMGVVNLSKVLTESV